MAVRAAALGALRSLVEAVGSGDALAFFVPGLVSGLGKALAAAGAHVVGSDSHSALADSHPVLMFSNYIQMAESKWDECAFTLQAQPMGPASEAGRQQEVLQRCRRSPRWWRCAVQRWATQQRASGWRPCLRAQVPCHKLPV